MNKNNENENVHVEQLDNTQVKRPVLLKRILKASPAKQIESYLKIYGVPQLPVLSADTRTPELKETNRKAGELELYRLKEEEQKQLNRLIALGIGTTGAIIGSLFTPAAPYVNAALAAHSGINLAKLYHEGTLGFNTETALNTLGFTPYGIKVLSYINKANPYKQLPILSNLKPVTRTKVGDVEVNTPAMAYRQGSKEMADDFLKTGVVNSDGYSNPMFAKGYLWYGIPDEKSLLLGLGLSIGKIRLFKRNEEAPKTHLLVSNAPMEAANSKSGFNSIRVGQLRPLPINDKEMKFWIKEGLLDEAINYNNAYYQGTLETPKTIVIGDHVRRIPAFKGAANKENTTLYEFVPEYGYKLITSLPNTYIWINSKNASMISDQLWDDAYNTAINVGDYKEAKRLRELHFQIKSGNDPLVFAHSTNNTFNQFDKSFFGLTDEGFNGRGFYFSTTRIPENQSIYKIAKGPNGEIPYMNYGRNKKYFYIKGDREYNVGDPNRNFFEEANTVGFVSPKDSKVSEVVVGLPTLIKNTRVITYDDNGNFIPLSKRDDFTNPDFRFGWLAPLFGVSAAAALTNSKKNKK